MPKATEALNVPEKTAHGPEEKHPESREEIILKYAPLIKYIANRIVARLPLRMDIQDMINAGVLGLMDALKKFDPEKGVKFETYAEYRIKGAILDNLRSLDWVPRSVRKVSSMLQQTHMDLEKNLGRPANDEEVAKAMDIDVEKLHKIVGHANRVSVISLEKEIKNDNSSTSLLDMIADKDIDTPFDKIDSEELRGLLTDNMKYLPEKEKKVLSLYYYNEFTMKKIGGMMNITESRVSQIHTKAVTRLRNKIGSAYCV
jgi:RNA polymerase sigma factor FliA